jgi:hypothetical protein
MKWQEGTGGVQRNFFLKSGQSDRYWPFMTSPGTECTSAELENPQLWLNGDMASTGQRQQG